MTVYIDVLLALNLYINYFLIRGTALFLHRNITAKRTLAAAAVGAIFSLTIFLPELPFILTMLIKAVSGAATAFTAFGYRRAADFIIDMLCFMVMSFMYAGLMMALWLYAAPLGMYYRNGSAYFDVPMIAVAVFTAVAYAVVRFMRYLSDKRAIGAEVREVTISRGGCSVTLKAIPDTGNTLCDPFSGTPVMICVMSAVDTVIPEDIRKYLAGDISGIEAIRLVPCQTVGGRALIPIFRADDILLDGKHIDALVGVSKNELGTECIFNPKLISI